MKKCAYCKTENRDEAIFCRQCRRPLQPGQTPEERLWRNVLFWLLVALVLIGLSRFLFSSRLFRQGPTREGTPMSSEILTAGPAPTRTHEPDTIRECVSDTIRIRRGPGTEYETTGGLLLGTCLTILGRNEEASWAYIVSDDGQTGWVAASLLPDVGDISRVSVRDDSRMRNPARPTLTSAEIAHGAQAYLTQVAETNIPGAPLTRYIVPCFETANRVGNHISCRMERAYCDYLPAVEGSPTFCSDRPAPDHTFVLIVFGEDWSDYDGQCLIVSGYLEIGGGALQIEALDRSQISPCS